MICNNSWEPIKVGNKIDLLDRQVTTTEASQFARDNGCFYMETSALDGTGVNQAFYTGTVHANLDNSLLEIIKIK